MPSAAASTAASMFAVAELGLDLSQMCRSPSAPVSTAAAASETPVHVSGPAPAPTKSNIPAAIVVPVRQPVIVLPPAVAVASKPKPKPTPWPMPRGPQRQKEAPAVIETVALNQLPGGNSGGKSRAHGRRRSGRVKAPAPIPATDSIFNKLLARAEERAANPKPFVDNERQVLERFQDAVVHEGMRVRCEFDVPYQRKPAEEKKKHSSVSANTSGTATTGKTERKRRGTDDLCSKRDRSERNRRLKFDATHPRRSSATQALASIRSGSKLDAVADSKYFSPERRVPHTRALRSNAVKHEHENFPSKPDEGNDSTHTTCIDAGPTRRKSARVRNGRAQRTERRAKNVVLRATKQESGHTRSPRTTRKSKASGTASASASTRSNGVLKQEGENEDEVTMDAVGRTLTAGMTTLELEDRKMDAASDSTNVTMGTNGSVFIEEDVLDAGDEFSTVPMPVSKSRKRPAPYSNDGDWVPGRRRIRRRVVVPELSSSEDESDGDDDVDADFGEHLQVTGVTDFRSRHRRKAVREVRARVANPKRPVRRAAVKAMLTMTPDQAANSDSDDQSISDLDVVNNFMNDVEEHPQPPVSTAVHPQKPPQAPAQQQKPAVSAVSYASAPVYLRLPLHAIAHAQAQSPPLPKPPAPPLTPAPAPAQSTPKSCPVRLQLHKHPKRTPSLRAHCILESGGTPDAPLLFRCQLCGFMEHSKQAMLNHLLDAHQVKCERASFLVRSPAPLNPGLPPLPPPLPNDNIP